MTNTQEHAFDSIRAAEHHRLALLRIVGMLFALIGLPENVILGLDPKTSEAPSLLARTPTLPRFTRNHVLRILRPAESAARRLIVIAARGIRIAVRPASKRRGMPTNSVILGFNPRTHSVKLAKPPKRKNTGGLSIADGGRRLHGMGPRLKAEDDARCETLRSTADTAPSLPLLDTLKRFDFAPPRRHAATMPRIRSLGGPALPVYMRVPEPAAKPLPAPGDPLDATRLCARMHALKRALDDIPGQAKRLARWEARCDLRRKRPDHKPGRNSPMRPGWPPGYRKRPVHEVDDVLRECHSLAVYAQRRDTS